MDRLAVVFQNRRQYERAASYWKESLARFRDRHDHKRKQLDQIVKNWGSFEPLRSQAAGKPAVLEYSFRNGAKVSFEAYRLKLESLLADIKQRLKSNPVLAEYEEFDLNRIGQEAVLKNDRRYLGEKAAAWQMELARSRVISIRPSR